MHGDVVAGRRQPGVSASPLAAGRSVARSVADNVRLGRPEAGPLEIRGKYCLLPRSYVNGITQSRSRTPQQAMSYAYLFKYIIIGDTGVGKSCLLLQVCF